MASILWLRMGKRSAKTRWAEEVPKRMWNSIPVSSHTSRKVSIDMPCGGTMLATSTSQENSLDLARYEDLQIHIFLVVIFKSCENPHAYY